MLNEVLLVALVKNVTHGDCSEPENCLAKVSLLVLRLRSYLTVVLLPIFRVRGERRDPEGIEHTFPSKSLLHISESTNAGSGGSRGTGSSGTTNATSGLSGSYDHSQEYDPYQSAARQMQELLFGTSFLPASSSTSLSEFDTDYCT